MHGQRMHAVMGGFPGKSSVVAIDRAGKNSRPLPSLPPVNGQPYYPARAWEPPRQSANPGATADRLANMKPAVTPRSDFGESVIGLVGSNFRILIIIPAGDGQQLAICLIAPAMITTAYDSCIALLVFQ